MKLIDIANRIDKSTKNECFVDVSELACQLDVLLDYKTQNRLKSYWVGNWYCTDSYVGYKLYFLDDIPVAFSIQQGRKCAEEIKWFSEDLALKVRAYLISLSLEDSDLRIDFCDINEDIGDSYKIEFNSQVLNPENAMFNGQSVKILEFFKESPDYGIGQKVKIQLLNMEEKIVKIKDLDFKFHINY